MLEENGTRRLDTSGQPIGHPLCRNQRKGGEGGDHGDPPFKKYNHIENLTHIANNQATLQVPNRFHYEWIESKYGELIEGCLKKSAGTKLTINYSIVLNNKEEDVTTNIKKMIQTNHPTFNKNRCKIKSKINQKTKPKKTRTIINK